MTYWTDKKYPNNIHVRGTYRKKYQQKDIKQNIGKILHKNKHKKCTRKEWMTNKIAEIYFIFLLPGS